MGIFGINNVVFLVVEIKSKHQCRLNFLIMFPPLQTIQVALLKSVCFFTATIQSEVSYFRLSVANFITKLSDKKYHHDLRTRTCNKFYYGFLKSHTRFLHVEIQSFFIIYIPPPPPPSNVFLLIRLKRNCKNKKMCTLTSFLL